MDVATDKIKNQLIIVGLILGLGTNLFEHGITYLPIWLFQILIPVVLFFLLFHLKSFGAGDIKLFSVIAGFLTIEELVTCIIASFFAGGIIAIIKVLFPSKMKHPHTVHFSIPILAGYLYYLGVMI